MKKMLAILMALLMAALLLPAYAEEGDVAEIAGTVLEIGEESILLETPEGQLIEAILTADTIREGKEIAVGDFIHVNKYEYGIRLPVTNWKIIPLGSPQRGDVVVFKYPMDESVDYIKRVVGVPGDTIEYRNKVVYVNGVEQKQAGHVDFIDTHSHVTLDQREENLSGVEHMIAVDGRRPSWVPAQAILKKVPECTYTNTGFICKVPEGKYFMMGDNRDNSEDSRYWGFVDDSSLVGRATFIWANFGDMSRIGSFR